MTPTAIRTVRTGRLLHITIDRPGRMNALGVDDLVALDTAISGAEATGARAIVLTGAGRAFCTGADLTAVTGEEIPAARAGSELTDPTPTALQHYGR
ncbi:enoyl-CoA hydratase/isomerase family protein (plasmid) [Gordonia polyisoprenivorans]|uniref:enoyl-CoA hydratase-related protein n=1 Tax=Gordonia polyisoprenivorans TaxID=84595 RepID=UPI0022346176|nr:enoyl-CoA hydratase/isomerase family protein [Gordonia polyisoprenivorans]